MLSSSIALIAMSSPASWQRKPVVGFNTDATGHPSCLQMKKIMVASTNKHQLVVA
jgi:hypothetical protein